MRLCANVRNPRTFLIENRSLRLAGRSLASAGLPGDEFGGDELHVGRVRGVERRVDRAAGELGGVLLDGGQLRPRIQGFDGAVEGDDGDVFGDAQAAFVNRAQGSECFKVRRREDRVWRVVAFQQRCGGFVAAFSCEP